MSYKPTKKTLAYLKKMISQRSWRINERIPSLSVLAEKLKVSYPTVRKAVRALETEGVLQNHGSLGFFVISNQAIELKKQQKNKYYLGVLKSNLQILELLGDGGTKIGKYILKYIPALNRIEAVNMASGEIYSESLNDLDEAIINPVKLEQLLKAYEKSPKTYRTERVKYDKQRQIQSLARIVSRHKKELGIHGE